MELVSEFADQDFRHLRRKFENAPVREWPNIIAANGGNAQQTKEDINFALEAEIRSRVGGTESGVFTRFLKKKSTG